MNLINRAILSKITEQLDNNLILILIGARQTGKTHLLKLLEKHIQSHYPENPILYLNLEDESLLLQIADYKSFLNFLKLRGIDESKKAFILLDEFQKLAQPTKLLKLIYDNHPQLKIIATGSSSLDIYKTMNSESMAGRKRIFNIYPLSFAEFLSWRYSDLEKIWQRTINQNLDLSIAAADFKLPSQEFAVFGGYPRIILSENLENKQEELKELHNAYLQKDIAGILPQENRLNYNRLIAVLSSQIGNLLNVNELSNTLKCGRSTIENFLFILENTFIIKQIPPHSTNKRKEITKMPKVYFLDTGLRNFIQKNFSELETRSDAGALIENAVLLELLKNSKVWHNIYFWRTTQGAEVDFIIAKNENLFPIEIKFQSFKKPIVPSGLKAFINIYHPQKGFVLTKDFSATSKYNNCRITFLPYFLAEKIMNEI